MNVLRALLVGLVSAYMVACSAAATSPAAPPTSAPQVQLRFFPKMLRPGMRAVMLGAGFERGEEIKFYLIRPDGTKTDEGESTADKSGGVAYEVDVTDDWQPGQYIARVQSKKNPARGAEQKIELLRR